MAVIYAEVVQWYCEECQDGGEASSQLTAERQVACHKCVTKES
jgi:hypothetical protein